MANGKITSQPENGSTQSPHGTTPEPLLGDQTLLTIDKVAGLLKCSTRHIYVLIRTRGLPFRNLGALTRFCVIDVRRWIASGCR